MFRNLRSRCAPYTFATSTLTAVCILTTTAVLCEARAAAPKPDAWTGVCAWPMCDDLARNYGLPRAVGVFVAGVYPESPAAEAGLKPGDVLLKRDDQWLAGSAQWIAWSYGAKAGDSTTVAFLRDGESWETKLTTVPCPSSAELLKRNRDLVAAGEAWAVSLLGYELLDADGSARDEVAAAECFTKAMEWHDSKAMRMLAWMNETGHGTAKNERNAAELYHAASELGDSDADLRLAQMYLDGRGVAVDKSAALRHVRIAVERGDASAKTLLGRMYESGQGVSKDQQQAIACYREAADDGDAQAQTRLGYLYAYGIGVTQTGRNRSNGTIAPPNRITLRRNSRSVRSRSTGGACNEITKSPCSGSCWRRKRIMPTP